MGFSAGILGVGAYLPEKVMTNFDLEKMVDTSNEWIVERTGIRERRIADPETATSDMSVQAARAALADAGVKAEELDLVIVATATPDYPFPSTACQVQDRIGAKHAGAFDLAAGCSGFVYGLSVASQMVASGLYQKILVVGAETLSRITDWTDRNTCVLFGDGAGAAVVGRVEEGLGVLALELGSDGSGAMELYQPAGGSRRPASHETIDEHGHFIRMNGREVFKFAARTMPATCKRVLAKAGLKVQDVDILFPHQANLRIIDNAVKHLKIDPDKVWVNIEKYGNTSAACIPVCLVEAQQEGRLHKGDVVLAVAFGTGLTWASIVLKWAK
ncbi:MAG: Beta-ketoacyl-[acyl-carrier-protein] synthase III [Succiniclasticum sp.]|jgi:3-oxoacyl-[acyl-carrier-protein] synthase III